MNNNWNNNNAGYNKYYGNSGGHVDDNYGNRMDDSNYGYNSLGGNHDSGYIDLNSAVDARPKKKKRKRIVRDSAGNIQPAYNPQHSYKKVMPQPKKKKTPPPPPKKKPRPVAPDYPDVDFEWPIRLNRYVANTGLCSRREADVKIKGGEIQVNGEVVTELGSKINKEDVVTYRAKVLSCQKKIYLLLNKPKGFVTTMDEPAGKKIVIDLVKSACRERIYPIGRLDKMTTGVLLFTNDGDLSLKLTHPGNKMRKVYQVTLNKPLTEEDFQKLHGEIILDDGPMTFDSIAYNDPEDLKQIGVEIHSGKNRIVRRMFEALDYQVTKLDRVYFAGLTRKGLRRGKWRFLTPEEVAFLKMLPC